MSKKYRFKKIVKYSDDFEHAFGFWMSFIVTILLLPVTIIFSLIKLWKEYWFDNRKVYWEEI